jgi:hypothetical protein
MQKAALFLIGLAVAASTVYAVVLRATTEETVASTEEAVATARQPATPVSPRLEPRTWGRLVVLDEPTVEPAPAAVIKTPPLVIAGNPDALSGEPPKARPVRSVARTAARPTIAPPEPGHGVMARFKAPPPASSGLPETPDRAAIARVMGSVRHEIQQCYDRGMVPGQVDLVLTVEGESGEVQKARVSATSSTATCIQRVARTLRFPRFAKDSITIRYPYSFR